MNENLYFIAIIPPDIVSEKIIDFKKDFSARFNSHKALKVMPHITLKTPFKLPFTDHAHLLSWFRKLYITEKSFKIELKNFGAFINWQRPVIFVHPIINTPLYVLQKEIITSFNSSFPGRIHELERKFKPHITVAYRDLTSEMFQKACKEYLLKEYDAVFEVNNFHLLQHDKNKWNIIDTYLLQKGI